MRRPSALALRPPVPQGPEQLPLQCSAGQHVQVHVDRLLGHAHRGVPRILRHHTLGHLLRRPAHGELDVYVPPEPRMDRQLAPAPWLLGRRRPMGRRRASGRQGRFWGFE